MHETREIEKCRFLDPLIHTVGFLLQVRQFLSEDRIWGDDHLW